VRVTTERVFQWWDYPVFVLLSVLALAAIGNFAIAWVEPRQRKALFLHPSGRPRGGPLVPWAAPRQQGQRVARLA